jgi:hypothetical protein
LSTAEAIADIFRSATVLDVDFSSWDRFIRLVTIADTMIVDGQAQIFQVDFKNVSSFKMDLDQRVEKQWLEESRPVWIVSDFEFHESTNPRYKSLTFWGYEAQPRISVVSETINISVISPTTIRSVYPEWLEKDAGLARPSLETLATQ